MRRFATGLSVCVLLLAASWGVATQTAQLTVVDAAPKGEINQLPDANEIRVVFSEPMVALGRVPSNPTPPWMHIAPAIKGTYRWSGTTVLIFTPDPATPLPNSTRYTVTVDAAATSDAGRKLSAPFTFTFTTPTLKLMSARWYQRNDRADQPTVMILQFNQRVRPADVLAHLTVQYQPHDFDAPNVTDVERARMRTLDPAGLQRLDAKIASAAQTAKRTDAVAVKLAADWDKKRFPASDSTVVIETTGATTPGGFLRVALDASATSAEGREHPPRPQQSTVELNPVFFVTGAYCRSECAPSGYNRLTFNRDLNVKEFAKALSVRDITDTARETAVATTAPVKATDLDTSSGFGLEDAGYAAQPPARTYAYHFDPALTSSDGQTLGYPATVVVENWHETAFTSFGDGHGVWETDGGPQLPFYSRNYRSVTEWLTRLSATDLMPRILELEKNNFGSLPPGNGTPRRLNLTVDATQSHGFDVSRALSTGGTGLMWVGVDPSDPIDRAHVATHDESSTIVQVTNLGITVKDSPQGSLVLVTRLDNGEAVPDAQVTFVNTANKQLWRGSTGRDGVVMAPAMPLRDPENWYELSFLVTAEKNGDVGYVVSNWNEGIEPWDFGASYGLWEASDVLRGSIFTDRGVYKPGEEVHVKAILRADTPNGIRLLPSGQALDIVVSDSRGVQVDKRSVNVNRWSSAEWTWTIPASGTLGNYSVRASMPRPARAPGNDVTPRERNNDEWRQQVHGAFLVAAYRKPDFRVDTTLTTSDPPIAGATLHGALDARYLFGSAMSQRPVKWSVTKEPTFEVPDAILAKFPDDKYQFGYYDSEEGRPSGRVDGEDDAKLTTTGKFAADVKSETNIDFAYRYTFEGDVEDVSRQHIANRSSVVVHPAPWYIGLSRANRFADVTRGTSTDVVAVDLKGQAVAGVPITLSLVHVQWNSVRHAEGNGYYSWDSERVETKVRDWNLTSAATPVHVDIPVSDGGFYELRAIAKDAAGHSTRTDDEFYAVGAGYTAWERYDNNRIKLEPEKPTLKPGDTARIMIQSPWESATALMTVEREGIRSYTRFNLTSTQQTVEVPITEKDIPNVFVSVMLIRGRTSKDPGADGSDPGKPAFRLGYTELKVVDASKHLGVSVSADHTEYRPATSAKVSVDVHGPDGAAAPGEVTLWAVDYGVLSLTNYTAPDIVSAIYQHKDLQVMTEDNRQRIISRRVLTPKGANDGGGGGNEAGAGAFRKDFRPLAFWLGSVETDASGHATKDVTLPEALTTYRIMAVAADSTSRFGSASAEIKVNKPVTLLAAFPRFMTMGDRASFGGVVTNTLATGGAATVTIKSLDPALLQFDGSSSQTLQLKASSTEPIRFDATARGTGVARVQMTVALGSEKDAFETTIPVSAPTLLLTSAASGDATDAASTQPLELPAAVVPGVGGLNVSLGSTALVGLGEGVRYLVDYAFWCAEQKSSSALALALSADLGSAFQMSNIAPAEYRERAASLLAELPHYQCNDGGFNYWSGGCLTGNEYLTSYVLHVMKVTGGLGFTSDDQVIKRALDFLDNALKAPAPQQAQWLPAWSASHAFSVKVLAEYGRNEDANITRLTQTIDRLPIFALSYLADAMYASHVTGARYDDVVRRLTNALRVEGDQAHVEEIDADILVWLWNSNVRSTAIVLDGFVRRGDASAQVPGLVRWLLQARRNGRWGNTQENATSLEALVAYYKKFEADVPDMTATVAIASAPVGTKTFRGRSSTAQTVTLAMPDLIRSVAAGAKAPLSVSRTGTGHVYYTARMQYALTTPLPGVDQGIHVERRYEPYVEKGTPKAGTTFNAGDLIRVTLVVTLPAERRFVAVTDPFPAGVEAVDSWFATTATDLSRDASRQEDVDTSWGAWYRHGGFDHVEKYDDRVQLFATRLSEGRHEFSYVVRATTQGTFGVAGTRAEEMYAPEVNGRTAPATIVIK